MQRMDFRMKPVSDKKCLLVSEVWPADEELSHTFRRGFVPLSGLQGGGGAGFGHVDLTPRWQKGHV